MGDRDGDGRRVGVAITRSRAVERDPPPETQKARNKTSRNSLGELPKRPRYGKGVASPSRRHRNRWSRCVRRSCPGIPLSFRRSKRRPRRPAAGRGAQRARGPTRCGGGCTGPGGGMIGMLPQWRPPYAARDAGGCGLPPPSRRSSTTRRPRLWSYRFIGVVRQRTPVGGRCSGAACPPIPHAPSLWGITGTAKTPVSSNQSAGESGVWVPQILCIE